MARKPNYRFERHERERMKAAKKAAKAEAKAEKRGDRTDDPSEDAPSAPLDRPGEPEAGTS